MNDLTSFIKNELKNRGANLVGIGDLSELPSDERSNLPLGICVALKYPQEIIEGIADLPTPEYRVWYNKLNEQLDDLVVFGAEILKKKGYAAIGKTREHVGHGDTELKTLLPHKTVATRAGLGWIGKCALMVTEEYGSMLRISVILTDAPLETATPIDQSRCGECMVCTEACPAEAVSGKLYEAGMRRDDFFNAAKCQITARERSVKGFGGGDTICGKCIEVCPYTRRSWK